MRAGQGNLTDAFARIENNEVWLYNFDIQPYKQANQFNHEPKAVRRSAATSAGDPQALQPGISVAGRSLVALKMYWKGHRLKVLLGVGIGKNVRDKREDLKKAVAKREMDQALKEGAPEVVSDGVAQTSRSQRDSGNEAQRLRRGPQRCGRQWACSGFLLTIN